MSKDPADLNLLLFLCTGNYYRSRTAEEVFNHYAALHNLAWQAGSKGLREDMENSQNPGPMAKVAIAYLEENNIALQGKDRYPETVQSADFVAFDRIICLDREEHLPMMERRFPIFADEVEYWHFPDMPFRTPEEILPAIHARVQLLVAELN